MLNSKISLTLLQLLMNNQVQFACLWSFVPPDFVVQINRFLSLILFSAVFYKRRWMQLIIKIIKYKLDSSSKMKLPFFILKTFTKFFWKILILPKIRKWRKQQWVGRGHVLCVIMRQCIRNRCDSPFRYIYLINIEIIIFIFPLFNQIYIK